MALVSTDSTRVTIRRPADDDLATGTATSADTAPDPSSAPGPGPAGGRAGGARHRLGVVTGLSALSLDAMASVAYGPEAVVLVLAAAGGAGLGLTVPVTAAIAGLLLVLTVSYRQVITAFPQGGGAYGVARAHLGRRASLVAAASLVVDYVLNVAVSVAAGVAALTSAVPGLRPWTLELGLAVLALVTAVNLRGIAASARAFIVPTALFVLSVLAVVVVGLVRDTPAVPTAASLPTDGVAAVGILLLLKAFANGCASLTGVEAIANAVPSFREPSARRAARAEVVLGGLLAVMLLGIAALVEKFDVGPVPGVTVLAQVTRASLGDGVAFYVVQGLTVVLLALAANTSFGGLPVLARLLARDHRLPHVFALRADRDVHRYGVVSLAVAAGALLVVADGSVNALVPLFAIGVFVGFTISQAGMVRHWVRARPEGWRARAVLNGVGAALTGTAALVVGATKLTEGGWLVVVALPVLVVAMSRVEGAYGAIGRRLGTGAVPARPVEPGATHGTVVVPVNGVSELTRDALGAARTMGERVVALHVVHPGDDGSAADLAAVWRAWDPGVPLVQVVDEHHRLDRPVLDYVRHLLDGAAGEPSDRVLVVIADCEPRDRWVRLLQNRRGDVLARALGHRPGVVVCRLRFAC